MPPRACFFDLPAVCHPGIGHCLASIAEAVYQVHEIIGHSDVLPAVRGGIPVHIVNIVAHGGYTWARDGDQLVTAVAIVVDIGAYPQVIPVQGTDITHHIIGEYFVLVFI